MDTEIVLNDAAIAVAVGVVIPMLNALATKPGADGGVRGLLSVIASVVTGLLVEIVSAGGFHVGSFAITAFVALAAATATYYQLYEPTGIDRAVQAKTARVGIAARPRHEAAGDRAA